MNPNNPNFRDLPKAKPKFVKGQIFRSVNSGLTHRALRIVKDLRLGETFLYFLIGLDGKHKDIEFSIQENVLEEYFTKE